MKELLDNLRKSVLVLGYENCQRETHKPYSSEELGAISARVGPSFSLLPSKFLEGFHFGWSWSDPDWEGFNASGQIHCPGVTHWLNGNSKRGHSPFGNGHENHLWSTRFKNGWEKRYDSYLLIDDLGLGNAVLMDCNNGDLYFWLFNVGAYRLSITPEAYFDTAIRFRGLYLWQKFFLTDDTQLPADLICIVERQVSKLFPELTAYSHETATPRYLEISKQRQYVTRFEPIYTHLLQKGAKVNDAISDYGAKLASVNKLIQSHSIHFDDELLAFFLSCGTFKYDWEINLKNGQKAGGEFFLYGLEDMFGGPREDRHRNVDWDFCTFKFMNFGKDEADDPDYEQFVNKWTFYWDPNCQLLLTLEDGSLKFELMHDVDEIYPFNPPFETFIDRLIDTAGLQSWMYQIRKEKPPVKLVPFEGPLREIFPEVAENGFYFHS